MQAEFVEPIKNHPDKPFTHKDAKGSFVGKQTGRRAQTAR